MSNDDPLSPDPLRFGQIEWTLPSPDVFQDPLCKSPEDVRFASLDSFLLPTRDFEDSIPPFDRMQDLIQIPGPVLPQPISIQSPSHHRAPSSPARAITLGMPQFDSPLSILTENKFVSVPLQKTKSSPIPMPRLYLDSDEQFNELCSDTQVRFNPHKLGFIPIKFWPDKEFTFGELVRDFFQRKNNANSRFSHKLFNALKISQVDHFYVEYLGVEWLTDTVLKVDKKIFARLLGIKTIDGSLFHQQGNFPSHGFVEMTVQESREKLSPEQLKDVDYENVRLLVHQANVFVKGCDESVIEGCKWIPSRKRL